MCKAIAPPSHRQRITVGKFWDSADRTFHTVFRLCYYQLEERLPWPQFSWRTEAEVLTQRCRSRSQTANRRSALQPQTATVVVSPRQMRHPARAKLMLAWSAVSWPTSTLLASLSSTTMQRNILKHHSLPRSIILSPNA